MNAKELATLLNGREYTKEITRAEAAQAKADGLVVVFGASDDLMELRGAIYDEYGAPRSVFLDAAGLIPEFNDLCEDKDWQKLRDYFTRFDGRKEIEAIWFDEPGSPVWVYRTDIPHETFDILEDGQPYCRGIAFALADAGPKPAAAPVSAMQAMVDVHAAIESYLGGYEFRGDTDYTPSADEFALINDAVQGLICDDQFRKAFAAVGTAS